MCLAWLSQHSSLICIYSISWLVFLVEEYYVLCEVRMDLYIYRHSPSYAVVMLWKFRRKSEMTIYIWSNRCACTVQGFYLQNKLRHTEIWSAAAWPPRRLSYRPAVFFHHLVSLHVNYGKEKFSARLKNSMIWISLLFSKFRNLKLSRMCLYAHIHIHTHSYIH
jgi:hypothetical protein